MLLLEEDHTIVPIEKEAGTEVVVSTTDGEVGGGLVCRLLVGWLE